MYDIVSKFGGVCNNEEYDAEGNVQATIICDTSNTKVLQSTILDATRGTAAFFDS